MNRGKADFEAFTAVAGWKLNGPDLKLRLRTSGGKEAHLAVRALSREAWKISILPPDAPPIRPTPMVVPSQAEPLRLTAKAKKGCLTVSGPEIRLEFQLDPFGLRFVDRAGRSILSGNPGDVDGLGRPNVPPFGFMAGPRGASSIAASFHLGPDERLYGLDEKFTRLDKAGRRFVSWTVSLP